MTEYYAIYVLQYEKEGQVLRRLVNLDDINYFESEAKALQYLIQLNATMERCVILKEYRIMPK